MAHIYSIAYQPQGVSYGEARYDAFIRTPVQEAIVRVGHGIEGDQKAGRNPRRQINLLSLEWLEALRQQGFQTEPGRFGEQLIIAGLEVNDLQPGDTLYLGDDAAIEITMPRNGCIRLDAAQGAERTVTEGPIGMLATVVQNGTIRVGDPVRVIKADGGRVIS